MKTVSRTWALLGAIGAIVAIVAVGFGCAGAGSSNSDHRLSNADVSLISFGSVQGEVAPCG